MSGLPASQRHSAMWPTVWITAVLALGAGAVIPWIAMALHQDDIEALESPLLLSVARQLESGPPGLYGPYGGPCPLVLIHAPLYYRLAALAGWPLNRVAFDSVTAALVAGRLLSSFGFMATLAAAYRLALLGGMPPRAGWWAALLVAGTPISGGFLFEVRPDMLGIGLQTTGILLVLSAFANAPIREAKSIAGFTCFALAACIKQHYVAAPLVSLFLMAGAWARGRCGLTSIARCASIALAIVVIYYGIEEWITAGRMSQSVVVAAGSMGNVHPSNWYAARNQFLVLISKCVGMILLAAAAGLAMVSARPRPARLAFVIVGTALIGAVTALAIIQLFMVKPWISAFLLLGLLLVIVGIIPACGLFEKSLLGGRLDAALWAYWGGELALTAVVWRLSAGTWFNYALQALVIACVLTARALSRAIDGARSWRPLIPAALAALAVPAFAFTDATQVLGKREVDGAALARLLVYVHRPSTEIFFVDLPGANRAHGRIDLVYDPWLYPVFESIGLAEPRSIWLDKALSTGPVRVVATTSRGSEIDGLKRTLPDLGYSLSKRVGPYFVWARQTHRTL
jgi:hypothetical protein